MINKNFFWLQEEPRKGALTNTDLIPSLKRIIAETKNIAKSYKRETRYYIQWFQSKTVCTYLVILYYLMMLTSKAPAPDEALPWFALDVLG